MCYIITTIFKFHICRNLHRRHENNKSVIFRHRLLVLIFTCFSCSCLKAQNGYPVVKTPQNVSVNYTLPKPALGPGDPLTVTFSKRPKDEEIFRTHFLEIPLAHVNRKE